MYVGLGTYVLLLSELRFLWIPKKLGHLASDTSVSSPDCECVYMLLYLVYRQTVKDGSMIGIPVTGPCDESRKLF